MSTLGLGGPDPDPGQSGELQFERAEYTGGTGGQACSNCQQPAAPQYHEFNGRIFCSNCRQQIEQSIEHLHQSGSLARALLFGLAAAIVGALIFYAVSAITGYEFGLIAIVVGLLVGKAVRKGSGSLGGWRYQALAMILTYVSIVSTYIPAITSELYKQAAQQEKVEADARAKLPPGTSAPPSKVEHVGAARFYLFVFFVALISPVAAGFKNIIGLIIIGIGLWEAWKFNRRVEVKFAGPFSAGGPAPAPGAP